MVEALLRAVLIADRQLLLQLPAHSLLLEGRSLPCEGDSFQPTRHFEDDSLLMIAWYETAEKGAGI